MRWARDLSSLGGVRFVLIEDGKEVGAYQWTVILGSSSVILPVNVCRKLKSARLDALVFKVPN